MADWLLTACEVGQGDAMVLSTGEEGTAVVVDTGPEPILVDSCLDRLGIGTVALLILTHLHADHVDGLPGAWTGGPSARSPSARDASRRGLAEIVQRQQRPGDSRGRTQARNDLGQPES